MKKSIKKLLVLTMAVIMSFSTLLLTACGRSIVDPNKIQVYVYVVSDGYGHQHVDTLVKNFTKKYPEYSKYQFIYEYGQTGVQSLEGEMNNDIADNKNIYIGPSSSFQNMIRKNQLIDISDVYEMEVDGKKIKDKVLNYAALKDGYSYIDGTGMYAIPHATTISSAMVFDFDHFLRSGYMVYAPASELSLVNAQVADAAKVVAWDDDGIDTDKYYIDETLNPEVLVATKDFGNYEEGEVILTAGKDGKYGTYDDGQVKTTAEFYELMKKITGNGEKAFIYSTQYATANTPQVLYHMLYQTLGYENTRVFTAFDGALKDAQGNKVMDVNWQNADEMWDLDIVKNAYNQAAEFFDKTIMGHNEGTSVDNVEKYLHKKTYNNGPTTSFSHTDAQTTFLTAHKRKGTNNTVEAAFLCDGGWWENEADDSIISLYGSMNKVAEHRFYLTPITEGQIEDESVTVFQGSAGGSCMLYLNNYPDKVKTADQKKAYDDAAKAFMAYCCSDEALNIYTATHGIKANFDYEITEATMKKLTPFQKNIFEMLSDTEHIKIVDGTILGRNKNAMRWYGEIYDYPSRKGTEFIENPYTAMSGKAPKMVWTEYASCVKAEATRNYDAKYATVMDFMESLGL